MSSDDEQALRSIDYPELRAALNLLVAYLEREGCPVRAEIPSFMCSPDEAGAFNPPQPGGTEEFIQIARQYAIWLPGPTHDELATLMHEAGHWRSWKTEQRPEQQYWAAVERPDEWPSLSNESKHVIYDEEVRAWALGRDVFDDAMALTPIALPEWWTRFYEWKRNRSLEVYRTKLGHEGEPWAPDQATP